MKYHFIVLKGCQWSMLSEHLPTGNICHDKLVLGEETKSNSNKPMEHISREQFILLAMGLAGLQPVAMPGEGAQGRTTGGQALVRSTHLGAAQRRDWRNWLLLWAEWQFRIPGCTRGAGREGYRTLEAKFSKWSGILGLRPALKLSWAEMQRRIQELKAKRKRLDWQGRKSRYNSV